MSKDCLLELVLVLYQLYIDKLQLCRKSKEKFTRLQLAWMETMRDVIHLTEDQSDEGRINKSYLPNPVSSSEIRQCWNVVVEGQLTAMRCSIAFAKQCLVCDW